MERTRVIVDRSQQPGVLISKATQSLGRTIYSIRQRVTSIGRSSGNDVVLQDPTVSRHHATVRLEDGGYFLYDFASTNGTPVNGQRIYRKKLADGDIIELGRSALLFVSKEVSLPLMSPGPTQRNQ
jgi:pSer/pThr/pTyr-binding forkhead associated (FHA) protein